MKQLLVILSLLTVIMTLSACEQPADGTTPQINTLVPADPEAPIEPSIPPEQRPTVYSLLKVNKQFENNLEIKSYCFEEMLNDYFVATQQFGSDTQTVNAVFYCKALTLEVTNHGPSAMELLSVYDTGGVAGEPKASGYTLQPGEKVTIEQ